MQPHESFFVRGVQFIRRNPQLLSTLFLLIAIPLAFLYTSQQFLLVAAKNQEQLESGRVTMMQDVFSGFIVEHLGDSEYLSQHIQSITRENATVSDFAVLVPDGTGGFLVRASAAPEVVGQPYQITDEQTRFQFGQAATMPGRTLLSEMVRGGERHWLAVRAITDASSTVTAYLSTDVSMANIDAIARKNIRDAYVVLIFVIIIIFFLLLRQARIIDYATLYRRLKEVDQMKDDFVSMAAHELRSPLTIIRGYVELLGEETTFDEKGKQHLANIDMAASSLNALVGDILDVSRLQEGRMSFEIVPTDVVPVITEVVHSFERPAQDKGLSLTLVPVASLPQVLVDPGRFRQVLVNLVGNAIKYTPQGGVTVSIQVEKNMATVRVSDTGMGISAEDQQKLFQKFYRIRNKETETITGTGLGLWITAQMVTAMRGTMSVESIRGKGSDFIVRLPLAEVRAI